MCIKQQKVWRKTHFVNSYTPLAIPNLSVMVWNGRRTGHRQRSQWKWRPQQADGSIRFYCCSSRQFSAHPKSSLTRIDKRTARAARNTRYRYNQIGPLDHKMADNCVSLVRTNTLSSTVTKLIKTWKISEWKLQLQPFKPCKQNVQTWLIYFTTRVGSVACACL